MVTPVHPDSVRRLRAIKVTHTVVWAVFAAAILALPIAVHLDQWRVATLLIALVSAECIVLLANRMTCPLTGVARRYTDDQQDNFDIYLPLWLARYNKQVFGGLFAAALLYALVKWFGIG